jgi:hypothetical protein
MPATCLTRFGFSLLAAIVAIGSARADIVGTTGSAIAVPAPASVIPQDTESNTAVLVYFERSQVLGSDLQVDANGPGLWTAPSGSSIAAGTAISSYYLHADKIGDSAVGVPYSGSVTFDEPIIGVIGVWNRLNTSNFLGNPATAYSSLANRGWEFSASEFFSISGDGKTLTFQNSNSTVADQLRIVTSAVPEPGTGLLASIAGLGLLATRRPRRQAARAR